MSYNVIFSNKSSTLNQKLIKFFNVNLLSLNKANIIFDFEVADPKKADIYNERGIKNYPVLIYQTTSVTGVEKIIKYLKINVEKYNKKIVKKKTITDDEVLNEFWGKSLGGIKHDESGNVKFDEDENENDDEYDLGENLQHKLKEAIEKRNAPIDEDTTKNKPTPTIHRKNNIMNSNDPSPSDIMKNMSNKTHNSDDMLMARFFENQGEN